MTAKASEIGTNQRERYFTKYQAKSGLHLSWSLVCEKETLEEYRDILKCFSVKRRREKRKTVSSELNLTRFFIYHLTDQLDFSRFCKSS